MQHWWGFSKEHCWVFLDRTLDINTPGYKKTHMFVICATRKCISISYDDWDMFATFAPTYLSELSEDLRENKSIELSALKNDVNEFVHIGKLEEQRQRAKKYDEYEQQSGARMLDNAKFNFNKIFESIGVPSHSEIENDGQLIKPKLRFTARQIAKFLIANADSGLHINERLNWTKSQVLRGLVIDGCGNESCHAGVFIDDFSVRICGDCSGKGFLSNEGLKRRRVRENEFEMQKWKQCQNQFYQEEKFGKGSCSKCSGSGYLPSFSHIEDGICFSCHGTGNC